MTNKAPLPIGKIFWYKKRDGTIIDESEASAWQVHNSHMDPRVGHKYLGWSDGRFIQEAAMKNRVRKDKDTGMLPQMDDEQQSRIREAVKKELEFAKEHRDPPMDQSREELVGGARGVVQPVKTTGLTKRMP